MKRNAEKKLESLGAFEISNSMLKLAKNNEKNNVFLNAGRGNPNWINKKARFAFNRVVEFGIAESERTMNSENMAGYTELYGIKERFEAFLEPEKNQTDAFLLSALNYVTTQLQLDGDEVVKEWVDGVIGNNYPVPSRILKNTEVIINAYLESILYPGKNLQQETDLFLTEGGTAAIVYIFNSLKENKLIHKGDKIAINTPIFTPYLQIPELNDYEMVEVDLHSNEENNWEIQPEEIDKLNDSEIKALFLVNPSNPGSKALNQKALNEIKSIVKKNPNLMIITDDVYGSFVPNFESVYGIAPHNTLLVYSFSKLFGATGWRLGAIALHQKNIFDKLIKELPQEQHDELKQRYDIVVLEPKKLKFIDRLVADSRSVGLYHTSGLSTPQQMMEVFFSLAHLVAGKKDPYIAESIELVTRRYEELYNALNISQDNSNENAKYYTLIDIYKIAESTYGEKFRHWLETHFEQIDFLENLAEKNGVVLMDGVGFGSKAGTLRVSQANLPTENYRLIGKQILELLKEYHEQFVK